MLNLSENLVRMRREKGLTQDALAGFLGVTKASVSKWETKQSLPDILLLPQLASFFDVTIDELMGYEPQLSREQIRKEYHELAAEFAGKPFEAVMEKSKLKVKAYYSCRPFLMQICVLWLNHFTMAASQERRTEILTDIAGLCDHIMDGGEELAITRDAVVMKAMVQLQLGKFGEVIDALTEVENPCRFSGEALLVQAQRLAGQETEADSRNQMYWYTHLGALFTCGVMELVFHAPDWARCAEVLRRLDAVLDAFDLERLNPNTAAGYHYQAAVCCVQHGKQDEAIERLGRFVRLSIDLVRHGVRLHGDAFFDRLEPWFESLDLGPQGVRDQRLIVESVAQALENPAFAALDQKKLEQLKNLVHEMEEAK